MSSLNQRATIMSIPWKFAGHPPARYAATAFLPKFDPLGPRQLELLAGREYGEDALTKVNDADVVIFQPEGTITRDATSLRIVRLLSLPLYSIAVARKSLFVVNGTLPIFHDSRGDWLSLVLNSCDFVGFRDRLSSEYYKGSFVPDAAVSWEGCRANEFSSKNHVLLTTAGENSREQNIQLANSAIDHCQRMQLKPLVLTKQWEHLDGLRAKVLKLGGDFVQHADLRTAEQLLQRCKYHIGGRYHMALFCACLGIPSFIVSSETHKNGWLIEDITGVHALGALPLDDKRITNLAISRSDNEIHACMNELRSQHRTAIQHMCKVMLDAKRQVINRSAGSRPLRDAQFSNDIRKELRSHCKSIAKKHIKSLILPLTAKRPGTVA